LNDYAEKVWETWSLNRTDKGRERKGEIGEKGYRKTIIPSLFPAAPTQTTEGYNNSQGKSI